MTNEERLHIRKAYLQNISCGCGCCLKANDASEVEDKTEELIPELLALVQARNLARELALGIPVVLTVAPEGGVVMIDPDDKETLDTLFKKSTIFS